VVPALVRALDDPDLDVRSRAVSSLGCLRAVAAEALPALQQKEAAVRQALLAAQEKLEEARAPCATLEAEVKQKRDLQRNLTEAIRKITVEPSTR
jgi:HEAT repeat protein